MRVTIIGESMRMIVDKSVYVTHASEAVLVRWQDMLVRLAYVRMAVVGIGVLMSWIIATVVVELRRLIATRRA